MRKESQWAKIIAYCMEHGSITILEAECAMHITSASKRISEMRRSPLYIVEQEPETGINRDGNPVRYNRYRIRKVQHGA